MWFGILLLAILFLIAIIIMILVSKQVNIMQSILLDMDEKKKKRLGSGSKSKYNVLTDTKFGRIFLSSCRPTDQHTCNSCWAIAICQTVTDHLHKAGQILSDELNYYAFHDIIAEHSGGEETCETGAYPETGFDQMVKSGAPLMSETSDRIFNDDADPKDDMAQKIRISGWKDLSTGNTASTIANIKSKLESSGPVIGVIQLYDSFASFVGTSIYQPLSYETLDPEMAHVVSIIGYDDSDSTWIIRNSFGTNFGYHGYCKIRQGDPKLQIEDMVFSPIL